MADAEVVATGTASSLSAAGGAAPAPSIVGVAVSDCSTAAVVGLAAGDCDTAGATGLALGVCCTAVVICLAVASVGATGLVGVGAPGPCVCNVRHLVIG